MTAVGKIYNLQFSIFNQFSILKFSLLFLLFTLFSSLLATSASAQTPSELSVNRKGEIVGTQIQNQLSPTSSQLSTSYIPSLSPHTASLAIYNFGHAMSCILVGYSPIAPCLEYKFITDTQGMVRSVPYLSNTNTSNGLLGMSMSMIGEVIGNPPVNSSLFIADLGEQIGIKSASAQVAGSGSGVLAPIFKLWEVSRNISYLAMILIFVIVGLMVMFRQKLNPQTVVTIQMALPGLVIGLVMITFSYFLASLISDMAFVGTNLVGYYFSLAQDPGKTPAGLVQPNGQEDNVLTIFSRFTGILNFWNIKGALDSIFPYLVKPDKPGIVLIPQAPATSFTSPTGILGGIAQNLLSSGVQIVDLDPAHALSILATMLAVQLVLPFGGMFGGGGQAIAAAIPALISSFDSKILIAYSFSWIAMIILIYSMLKLLLKLINNFLSIIFLTIAAPFIFLAASIPGRQKLVTDWAENMLCNVLAFPAVFAVFYFAAYILGPENKDPLFAISNSVSVSNGATFPLLGGFKLDLLKTLLAYGALLSTPSIPDIICKEVGKPSQSGGLLAGAIGGAIAGGQKYQGQIQSGSAGFAQNTGRVTDTKEYNITGTHDDGTPIYTINPYASHAGQRSKVQTWFNQKFGGATISPEAKPVNKS